MPLTDRDIRADVTCGVAPEADGLTIPGPTVQTLILCAHAFRNVVEGRRPKLSEIADLPRLTRHPGFDGGRLLELAARLRAQDSVRLTAFLERSYLGVQSLPTAAGELPWGAEARLPQFPGLWACWRSAPEALLPSEPGDFFDRLGANAVVADGEVYSVLGAGQGTPITRVLIQSDTDAALPFMFSLTATERALEVEVVLEQPLGGEEIVYDVRFEDEPGIGFFWAAVRGDELDQVGAGAATFCRDEAGLRVSASLPWPALPRPTATGPVLFTLTVSRNRLLTPVAYQTDLVMAEGALTDPLVRVPLLIRVSDQGQRMNTSSRHE